MSTTTEKYGFLKPDPNDFYDVKEDISDNMDKVEEALSEFDDSGSVEGIKNFPDFLSKFLSGNKLATTLRNLKAGLQFVLHAGQIVNNCVTDNAGLPLSAAQGKVLKDLYTQLYSEVSNSGIPIVKKITDLYSIKASGFYYYDAGATNAPMSSRGGMIVANYLSDSWISLTIAPYASPKIYTNTKYNNTWVGWSEFATKDDLLSIDVKKYASGALSKGSQKEINLTFDPRTGYTRRYFVGELFGTGSNSIIVNVHGSTLSFFAFNTDADITATILCIYTKD